MLILSDALREQVIAHAVACHPDECCGILPGPVGGDKPTRIVPMANVAFESVRYRMDGAQQKAAYDEMDRRGEDPLALYHSHCFTDAVPSKVDVACASEPDAHYVIVSLKDPGVPVLRAWRIRDGRATEEEVRAEAAQPHKRA